MDTVVGSMDLNEAIFKRILDDEEFRRTLMEMYATRVYRRARTKGRTRLGLPTSEVGAGGVKARTSSIADQVMLIGTLSGWVFLGGFSESVACSTTVYLPFVVGFPVMVPVVA